MESIIFGCEFCLREITQDDIKIVLTIMSSSEIVLSSSSAATQVNFVEGRWTSDTIYDAVA